MSAGITVGSLVLDFVGISAPFNLDWRWIALGGFIAFMIVVYIGWYSTHSELQECKDINYRNHYDRLLQFLEKIGHIDAVAPNEQHLVICWKRPDENECSIPKAKAYWTEDGVTITLNAELEPEWAYLTQHLSTDSFLGVIRDWKMAMSKDLIARKSLFDVISKEIERSQKIPIVLSPTESQEEEPHITSSYVERLYHQVLSQKIGIRSSQITKGSFQNTEKNKVRLSGDVMIYSNDATQREKAIEFFFQSQASMLELAEAEGAGMKYQKAQSETNRLNNEIRKIIIAGRLPLKSRCDACPS